MLEEPDYKAALLEILNSETEYVDMYYGDYEDPPTMAILDGHFDGPNLIKVLLWLHNERLINVSSKRP